MPYTKPLFLPILADPNAVVTNAHAWPVVGQPIGARDPVEPTDVQKMTPENTDNLLLGRHVTGTERSARMFNFWGSTRWELRMHPTLELPPCRRCCQSETVKVARATLKRRMRKKVKMGQYDGLTPEEQARITEIEDLPIDRYVEQREALARGDGVRAK